MVTVAVLAVLVSLVAPVLVSAASPLFENVIEPALIVAAVVVPIVVSGVWWSASLTGCTVRCMSSHPLDVTPALPPPRLDPDAIGQKGRGEERARMRGGKVRRGDERVWGGLPPPRLDPDSM